MERDGYEEVPGCSGVGGIYDKRGKDFCYSTASTLAPIQFPSTLAPAPFTSGSCCGEIVDEMDQVKGRLEGLAGSTLAILDMLQNAPSPVAAPCEDRKDQWANVDGGTIRNWCTWAANGADPLNRCRKQDLYTDCPVTCDACP